MRSVVLPVKPGLDPALDWPIPGLVEGGGAYYPSGTGH